MGADDPSIFFQPPIEILSPSSAPFSKNLLYNFSTPYCTSTVAYSVTCYSFFFFFIGTPSNQRTNFCNFVITVNKITKTVGFPGNFVYKALRCIMMSLLQLNFLQFKKNFWANSSQMTKYQIRITVVSSC